MSVGKPGLVKNSNNDISLDILLYMIILYILFVVNVPWIEIGSFIILIILFIYGTIRFRAWLIDRRKAEIERLDDFLDQVILTLSYNITYQGFRIPEGFNHWYEISGSNRTWNNFSRLKPWLGWRTKRYNRFCNQIDEMIGNFGDKTRNKGIIHNIHTPNREYVLEEEYENYSREQLDELLEDEGLIGDKIAIEQLLRELANKSQRLLNKFQRLRTR